MVHWSDPVERRTILKPIWSTFLIVVLMMSPRPAAARTVSRETRVVALSPASASPHSVQVVPDSTGKHAQVAVPPSQGSAGGGVGPWGLVLNWFFLVSIVGMIGTVAFRLGVALPLGRREDLVGVVDRITRRLLRLAWVFAVVAIVVVPVRLGYQASLLAGQDEGVLHAAGMLLGSLWGSGWLIELASAALFLAAILLTVPSTRIGPWGLALAAALLGAVVPGLSGHAAAGGPKLIAVDTLHVLAAGTWVGSLACLVFVGIPAANSADSQTGALSAVVGAFSRLALPAVGVLVVTGVINALSHIAPGELLTTPYGRVLSIKLLVVAGAFALGFYNWRMVRPALESQPRSGLLSVPATVELVATLAVLAVTAALFVTNVP